MLICGLVLGGGISGKMRGDNFWKGVIVLCLTLLAGVFISDLFKSEKGKPKFARINKELNCQPADPDLKYHKLAESKELDGEKAKIDTENLLRELKEIQKSESQTKELLYRPDKDKFDAVNLLHKEVCSDPNEKK